MTDTNFRLSGGVIGEVTTLQKREEGLQVINQGIGFQDRIVSNVPPDQLDDIINDDTTASGAFMQFMSQGWEEGKFHTRGSVVTNGIFTMVANVLTLEQPFPQPDGSPTFTIPAFAPLTETDSSVVYSGHTWTFTENVLVKTLRIWVTELTATTNYRVVAIKDVGGFITTTVMGEPVLTADAFTVVAQLNELIVAGTILTVYIDALNSGADQEVTGGWNFTGQDNVTPPVVSSWNHDNANVILRIAKIDLDLVDRELELEGIIANSSILFADTNNPAAFNQYRTTGAPVDAGTYIQYPVVLQQQGEGGVPLGVTTMTATIPIPLPTEYAEELTGLADPAWATVVPFLQFDGVDQSPVSTTAFGVDLEAEITVFSEDWDVLSLNA